MASRYSVLKIILAFRSTVVVKATCFYLHVHNNENMLLGFKTISHITDLYFALHTANDLKFQTVVTWVTLAQF